MKVSGLNTVLGLGQLRLYPGHNLLTLTLAPQKTMASSWEFHDSLKHPSPGCFPTPPHPPANAHPGLVLRATLFTGHHHAPEKVSWLLLVCSFPAEAEPAFLNFIAKFMCPQMVLLTERSDLQAFQHHCFKRVEEMSASNYHLQLPFLLYRKLTWLLSETLQIFHISLGSRFLSRFWKAEVTDTWLLGDTVAESKHHSFLAQPSLPFRPWGVGQGEVILMWNSPQGC